MSVRPSCGRLGPRTHAQGATGSRRCREDAHFRSGPVRVTPPPSARERSQTRFQKPLSMTEAEARAPPGSAPVLTEP